jgi:3-methylcrotonyl-CoA carboxylase alpha subunit
MEFIFDSDNHYYFLEMNTRLQVEHPVTELVTGLDLVRHQLLIAAGEPLALTQEQIQQRGHAIEVRIYAEDSEHSFLPSTGTIASFQEPAGSGVRVDSGVENGDEITQFYDPMIAKLIVYGENRNAAIDRLQRSLEQSAIFGVTTNVPLLSSIAKHPAFREGSTHTSFLQEYHLLEPSTEKQPPQNALVAAAIYDVTQEIERLSSRTSKTMPQTSINPWQTLGPWRMIGEARTMSYGYQGQTHNIAFASPFVENVWNVSVDGQTLGTIEYMMGNESLLLLKRGEAQIRVYVYATSSETQVMLNGSLYRFERKEPPDVDATARGGGNVERSQKTLTAPMAGTIVKVQVHDGDTVEAQQVLVILSAMKMEHAITAPHEGKVRHVHFQEGAVVKGGAVVVELE